MESCEGVYRHKRSIVILILILINTPSAFQLNKYCTVKPLEALHGQLG